MKYSRFEELPVWKDAARLFVSVESFVDNDALRFPGDLKSQLLRAVLSISNNIAEGFERGTTSELLQFLYIARGSAGEARSMLTVMAGSPRNQVSNVKSQISDLRSSAESISRQLRAWADSLQNSDIKGQRHLNEATRARYESDRRRQAFLALLTDIRRRATTQPPSPDDSQDDGDPPPAPTTPPPDTS